MVFCAKLVVSTKTKPFLSFREKTSQKYQGGCYFSADSDVFLEVIGFDINQISGALINISKGWWQLPAFPPYF